MIILRKKLFSISNPKSTEQILLDDKTFTQAALNIIKAVEM